MNNEAIKFNLNEAKNQIELILRDCDGEYYDQSGDLALASKLSTVLNYLCNSWHYRDMAQNEAECMSQDKYEELAFSVPLFDPRFRLLDDL